MMRVSTTMIESFRLWQSGDWMPESDLINSILGRFTPTPAVKLGKAFHSVIEDPDQYLCPGGFACDGYAFDTAVMQPVLDLVDRRGFFELKSTLEIGGITLVAKADHICGASIAEFKTTCNTYDPDKYLDSFQWRAEVLIFQPRVVTYHTACLSDSPNGVIGLRSVESMNVFPYPHLERDCLDLIREFCAYVKARNLVGHLEQRQREAA
jgi:hypothetical protein